MSHSSSRRDLLCRSGLLTAALAAGLPRTAAATVPIRFASPTAADDPIGLGVEQFVREVRKSAGSAVAVRAFHRGVMGGESQALEQTMAGNIDIQAVSNTVLGTVAPELSVLDVPYGLTSLEQAWRVLDGDVGRQLNERVQARGLRVAGWAFGGSRCLISRSRPIAKVGDLAGMKLRVPPNETYNAIARAWNCVATTIPWPETYLALSQGVVDAIETAPGPSFDQKHFEVAKHLSRTSHLLYFHVWVISEKSWQSWTPAIRDAVLTAARNGAMLNREKRVEQELNLFKTFEERGMTVTDPDRREFASVLKPVQSMLKPEYAPLLKAVQALA